MRRKRHSMIANVFLALLVVFSVITVVKLEVESNRQSAKNRALKEEIASLEYEIDSYKNDLDSPKDDEYYEEKARDKLNLRLPEEIIFYNDLIN